MFDNVLPRVTPLSLSPRLAAELEALDQHPRLDDVMPVALAGYTEPSAIFLLGTETIITNGDRAGAMLIEGTIDIAVIEAREEETFRHRLSQMNQSPVALSTIDGFNYGNSKPMSLTIFTLPRTQ